MESPDVNVLVGAAIEDAAHHVICRDWLRNSLASGGPIGISELVLCGVIRVATNPRAFRRAATLAEIVPFTDMLLAHPSVTRLRPGDRHWGIFTGLCENEHVTGPLVSDAYHAALAIEHGATWITLDRDFAAFRWLRSRNLLSQPDVREERAKYRLPPSRRPARRH